MKYYYSSHDRFIDDIKPFRWRCNEFPEQEIKTQYLYSENALPDLKISAFDSSLVSLAFIGHKEKAFSDSDLYIVQDLPFKYNNLIMLKTKQIYDSRKIALTVNIDISIYLAFFKDQLFLVPDGFNRTGDSLSLIKLTKQEKLVTL